jgi:hypothetical protein
MQRQHNNLSEIVDLYRANFIQRLWIAVTEGLLTHLAT